MSKNSKGFGRRPRPVTLREMNAEFRGAHNSGDLEDILEAWDDGEITVETPKTDYRFTED